METIEVHGNDRGGHKHERNMLGFIMQVLQINTYIVNITYLYIQICLLTYYTLIHGFSASGV